MVIHEKNVPLSMEMSFFPSCPNKDESVGRFKPAYTDKGPRRQCRVACAHGLKRNAEAPVTVHDGKKDISMLFRS